MSDYDQQRVEHGALMDEFIRRLREAGVQVKPPVVHEIALDEDKKVPALTPWDFGGGTFLRFYFQEGSVQCPPYRGSSPQSGPRHSRLEGRSPGES